MRILGQAAIWSPCWCWCWIKTPSEVVWLIIDSWLAAPGCWATSCSDYTLTVPASGHTLHYYNCPVLPRKSCWNLHFLNPGHILGGWWLVGAGVIYCKYIYFFSRPLIRAGLCFIVSKDYKRRQPDKWIRRRNVDRVHKRRILLFLQMMAVVCPGLPCPVHWLGTIWP